MGNPIKSVLRPPPPPLTTRVGDLPLSWRLTERRRASPAGARRGFHADNLSGILLGLRASAAACVHCNNNPHFYDLIFNLTYVTLGMILGLGSFFSMAGSSCNRSICLHPTSNLKSDTENRNKLRRGVKG